MNAKSSCKVNNCQNKLVGLGYCSRHYERFKKYGDPLGGGAFRLSKKDQKPIGSPCKYVGCSGVTEIGSAQGYCGAHYQRWKKGADMDLPIKRVRQRTKRINKDGYVIWADRSSPHASNLDNGMVLEHRHVMGEHLGRPLFKDENVHHKNGNRSDNRLSNLELWTKSQPSGQRVKDKVAWAIKFLEEYGYKVTATKPKPA